jgi:hypothetical protein
VAKRGSGDLRALLGWRDLGGPGVIRCQSCGHANFAGEDSCEACGADLPDLDVLQDAVDFHGLLLVSIWTHSIERPPTIVVGTSARAAIARMKDDGLGAQAGRRRRPAAASSPTGRDLKLRPGARRHGRRGHHDPDPSCCADDTTAIALNKMAVGFRHIPIVEDGRLV